MDSLFKRLLKNNIFRLSALYSLLFFIASLAMIWVAYTTIEKNIQHSIEEEINAEITRYIGNYKSSQFGIQPNNYAFFIEKNGKKLAGNIEEIPEKAQKNLDDIMFSIDDIENYPENNANKNRQKNNQITPLIQDTLSDLVEVDAKEVITPATTAPIKAKGDIVGKTVSLNNTKIFIGKSSYNATERREDILDALSTALFVLLVSGIVGGLIISFKSMKRINRISKVSKEIMAGNLNLRIPVTTYNDDIEDLARNLNNMLDKIDDLVQTVKQVSNNVAHDLRTPLTRLRGNIETISHSTNGETQIEAESALQETDKILSTFASLLRISKIESGATRYRFEKINLSYLIAEVLDFYEILAEEKNQKVKLNIADNILVKGDQELLSQAIINILTNSIKYTQELGVIEIALTKTDKCAILTVQDNGNGIPEEHIGKITDRFYRLEKHRSMDNGNGLGLSLVKAIVENHNGKLSFENNNGLLVTIRLPVIV